MSTTASTTLSSGEQFVAGLDRYAVTALWTLGEDNVPLEPTGNAVPYVWGYADIRRELLRAGDLVSTEEADRRVLGYHNPGLSDLATTDNLFAGLQLVMPGELEAAHRHTAAAIRFVIEGEGAYTAVNGERSFMHRHDLVLTPNWQWHDHANESEAPIIWMDGLDMPMIRRLHASFYEDHPDGRQVVSRPDNASTDAFSSGKLNPTWWEAAGPHSPVVSYPWSSVERAVAQITGDPALMPDHGYVLEYTNPRTGGPLMPTLGCQIEVVPARLRTACYRRVHSTVYNVVRGHGSAIVNGVTLTFGPSDVIAVPIWADVRISNESSEDLVLFALTDKPVYSRLGLYRERILEPR